MTFAALLHRWKTDPLTAPNVAAWRIQAARPAEWHPLPPDLPPRLANSLQKREIRALYSHQAEAWQAARRGEHLAIATGTASGKTLCYNLPVLAVLEENPHTRALYLFPTKALAQDQLSVLHQHFSVPAAIYDGDTPQARRADIRKNARLVLSNPDMLHTGILPHHTGWADFFRHLRFVVIDELHAYRGVFGSHVANVLRRLKRVAAFYGARPQFILTSATIANPRELAESLIEETVTLIERDGSARGERHFLIYNPPVVEEALGVRKSALHETARLADDLLETATQAVIFARSRRSVELLLRFLDATAARPTTQANQPVRGYRSGYLPVERREIERGLREGSVRLVVATNALELGIDIGGMGAVLIMGYPGSVASIRQQAGRAGRGDAPAAAVLIATPNPLDQFLARHPEYLLERSPEQGLVNPNHLLILLQHIRCALFELPFRAGEGFGRVPPEQVEEYLDVLTSSGEAHRSTNTTYWMADAYPAAGVSLRSASPETVVLQVEDGGAARMIGEVDSASAPWMVHPRAVYLHEGQQYFVQHLDLAAGRATLIPVALDYFTEPLRESALRVLSVQEQTNEKAWGEVQVITQVTGFRKRAWTSGENLGQEALDLPPTEMQTTAYWLSIPAEVVQALSREGLWTNSPNDYGPHWPQIREQVRARDGFRCQMCGRPETARQHDVHHKVPFRMFREAGGTIRREEANRLENLITLCPECHRKAETNVRVRSGLAGLGYALSNLAPLFLMCAPGDLGLHIEPVENPVFGAPCVALYDQVPGGIGFSQKLFALHQELLRQARELISACPCQEGCPSCVGPGGENGQGGKAETLAILRELA
ncbi:MAG: DEAD/DEAH box helicase [Anaerolineales bacterium]|nr:DEAD/DEAH box helicase [Anaerolineales bacterium]MCX7754635.1 DEAD/DEAH box helicase [Anaerolineales bacterium]MDW8278298.1 DEAD/DEAH box helicase [Anaerolineales bacterium]